MLSDDAVWYAVWRRQTTFLSYELAFVMLLIYQMETVSGHFRHVTSCAPVVNGEEVAAESSPTVCEGKLCGVPSPSLRLGWNSPYLCFHVCPLMSVV